MNGEKSEKTRLCWLRAILSWPLRLLTRWCRSTWSWSFWRDWPAGVKCIAVIWMLLPFPHLYEILKIWLPWIHPLLDIIGNSLSAPSQSALSETASPESAPPQEEQDQSLFDQVRTSMLVVAAWYGVFFLIWRTVLADKQTQATDKQTEINRESHYTELFTKAVEQLGAVREVLGKESEPALEIRIGAIYSLERLAKDSERDYGPIIETLAAYIREHCPFNDDGLSGKEFNQTWQEWIESLREDPPANRSDIAAALTVLSRREKNRNWTSTSEDETQPDFTGANFRGATLWNKSEGLAREGTNLRLALLESAELMGVNLSGADLLRADLSGAKLDDANLSGADFKGILLVGTQLKDSRGLTDEMLKKVFGDVDTSLPDGLTRPAHWGSREDAIEQWQEFKKGK